MPNSQKRKFAYGSETGSEPDNEMDVDPVSERAKNPPVPKWACHRKSPRPCINQRLIDELKILRWNRFLEFGPQRRESISYARACSVIIACPYLIERPEQAEELPFIGEKIIIHVKAFLALGYIPEARDVLQTPRYKTLSEFVEVNTIGFTRARHLYDVDHIRSLDQLKDLGTYDAHMKYLEDLKEKISRKDVENIKRYVQLQLDRLEPGAHIEACGGYRRGKTESNDVDLLITYPHQDGRERGILRQLVHNRLIKKGLVPTLEEGGIIAESYSATKRTSVNNKSSSALDALDHAFVIFLQPLDKNWDGLQRSGSRTIARRVDLIVTKSSSWGSAVVGWTGSTQFERDLRAHAHTLGYKFDSGGIRRLRDDVSIEAKTEEDVFRVLQLPYLPPHLRNADP